MASSADLPGRSGSSQSGIALVGVLWLCILLGALASGLLALLGSDAGGARRASDGLAAEGYADAAVHLAIADLCDPAKSGALALWGRESRTDFDGHGIAVVLQDEAGKADLNFAPDDLLERLFEQAGLPPGESAAIADRIEERRTSALTAYRASLDDPSMPRAPVLAFHAVAELMSIPGMTAALFDKIQGAVTIHAQSSKVIVSTAPEMVLRSLPDLPAEQIDEILGARAAGRTDIFADHAEILGTGRGGLVGRTVSITAAASAGQVNFVRLAVIRLTGDRRRPYLVLEWGTPRDSGRS